MELLPHSHKTKLRPKKFSDKKVGVKEVFASGDEICSAELPRLNVTSFVVLVSKV
jgi:hypothetical protein